jgi:site-specific recombinase XerD
MGLSSVTHDFRIVPNQDKTYPPGVLNEDEIEPLIRTTSNRAPTGIRNRALITMMYRAGLGLSEALALKPKDIDADAGTITVLPWNGDKRRIARCGLRGEEGGLSIQISSQNRLH